MPSSQLARDSQRGEYGGPRADAQKQSFAASELDLGLVCVAITDAELAAIFERVRLTPSSFNLQHWRFVVVRDPARKASLRKAAFNQEQVEMASAAIVVVGKLTATYPTGSPGYW